jgi:hypothetical protein
MKGLPVGRVLSAILLIVVLVCAGYLYARYSDEQERREVAATELDNIVVALRENRNRLEVRRLSGTVTTNREVEGGPANLLTGEMTVRQPWAVTYFVDMGRLGLDNYIWDARTRTLIVRAPPVVADPPNIDESRQVVGYRGPFITRDMQTSLRAGVANGARQQAAAEAAKPENMQAAEAAARAAIVRNLEAPLRAAGIGDIEVVVQRGRSDGEQWDVSRSIADVLAERAGT